MVFLLALRRLEINGSRHDKLHFLAYPCRKKFLATPSSGKLVKEQGMGLKKKKNERLRSRPTQKRLGVS